MTEKESGDCEPGFFFAESYQQIVARVVEEANAKRWQKSIAAIRAT
jgi:hypothetical protein